MSEKKAEQPGAITMRSDFEVEIRERGRGKDGEIVYADRRIFMQLLVYRAGEDVALDWAFDELEAGLKETGLGGVIYRDLNDPRGLGLLTFSLEPADFVRDLGKIFSKAPAARLEARPEFTMIGRSYSTGYEQDLEFWLVERPKRNVLNPDWPWAIWYPLRRTGSFNQLEPRERGAILREHGTIGMAYGDRDLAHDIRLACHGLDAADNEFLIGLVGKELYPLSHIVQTMRSTRQTSEFMEGLGPFFVGYAERRVEPGK